jgi:hypothetical protein
MNDSMSESVDVWMSVACITECCQVGFTNLILHTELWRRTCNLGPQVQHSVPCTVACAECNTLPGQVVALSAAHQEGCRAEKTVTEVFKFKLHSPCHPTVKSETPIWTNHHNLLSTVPVYPGFKTQWNRPGVIFHCNDVLKVYQAICRKSLLCSALAKLWQHGCVPSSKKRRRFGNFGNY